ncbi:threonine synthase [Micromonospora sonneratiae]|uniref:Threonine synthase n=1 Tax=Micromonospora sonneratiae TaxID=1184706 RepID=A0ABW3Y946_9ACTN
MECGKESFDSRRPPFRCDCQGLLDVVHHNLSDVDADRLKHVFDSRLGERGTPFSGGVWRYKELIHPELPIDQIVTKYEGNTGLYESESLTSYAGVRKLWIKAQSENPSGSFKDNGMTVAVSHGRWLGYDNFACTSTGNTSSSMAMYAALSGSKSTVFLPSHGVSRNKALQTEAYGARLIRTEGGYDDGIRFLERHADEFGLYVCNSINPLRVEGQKSIAFELAHQLGWTLPDWLVVPGGALSNASAIGKGLLELHRTGFIDSVPRIAIVQAEGASPFHRMVAAKERSLIPEPRPATVASALNIGHPPNWPKAMRYVIEQSDGITVSVTDNEILEAKNRIDRSGIGCEPASAASLAGLRRLVSAGDVGPDETAACILTGNLLKDTDAIARSLKHEKRHGPDDVVPPIPLTPDVVRAML